MKVPHIRMILFLHLARRRIELFSSPCSFTTWFALKLLTLGGRFPLSWVSPHHVSLITRKKHWITFLFSTSEKWKPPLSQLSFSQRGKGLALVSQGTGAGLSSYQPLPHLRRAAMHYRHHLIFLISNCGSSFCLMSQSAFFTLQFTVCSIRTSCKYIGLLKTHSLLLIP